MNDIQSAAGAAYDAWFRAEVERALVEANDPKTQWVTHEEVRAEGRRRRQAWMSPATDSVPPDQTLVD